MKRTLTLLAISSLLLVLAAPLPAQFTMTTRLTANIPFEFVAGTRTLPAGDYVVDTRTAYSLLRIWNEHTNDTSAVLSNAMSGSSIGTHPEAKLVFNRYGNQYFLSRIWDGYDAIGWEIPVGKGERAASESAMSRAPETVVILARR
jgi:hypothetical protein